MSSNDVPAIVARLFHQLADQHGLSVGQPERSGSFDQLMQVAEAKNVCIRFIRDRGDEFLEVGSGTEWFSPDLVRLVLLGGQPKDVPADLWQDVDFLTQRFDEVDHLFQPQNRLQTIKQLRDMRMAKARCMFPNAVIDGNEL
jgi:hypothetical protein